MKHNNIDQIERWLQFQPDDFQELHQAAKNESIILFIGAGISKFYGCMLWNEMAAHLVREIQKEKIISFAEQDILLNDVNANPRKVISICYNKCKNIDKLDVYKRAIKESLNINNNDKLKNIYKKIFSIKATTYITTNIDDGIEKYIGSIKTGKRISIYNCTLDTDKLKIQQVKFNILKDGNIIYLHGSVNHIDKCILTVENYLNHYSQRFINDLFINIKKINPYFIFLGYGLNEWDIIERVYKTWDYSSQEQVGLLLSPIYSHGLVRFNLEMEYYKSFGVKPVPYIIDEDGYKKIFYVLNNLAKAIDKSIPSPYDIFTEIEEIGKYVE